MQYLNLLFAKLTNNTLGVTCNKKFTTQLILFSAFIQETFSFISDANQYE